MKQENDVIFLKSLFPLSKRYRKIIGMSQYRFSVQIYTTPVLINTIAVVMNSDLQKERGYDPVCSALYLRRPLPNRHTQHYCWIVRCSCQKNKGRLHSTNAWSILSPHNCPLQACLVPVSLKSLPTCFSAIYHESVYFTHPFMPHFPSTSLSGNPEQTEELYSICIILQCNYNTVQFTAQLVLNNACVATLITVSEHFLQASCIFLPLFALAFFIAGASPLAAIKTLFHFMQNIALVYLSSPLPTPRPLFPGRTHVPNLEILSIP